MKKRLTKSSTDKMVSGVLGGISEYIGIDATILRVIFLVMIFLGFGSPIPLYIILAIVMPSDYSNQRHYHHRNPHNYGKKNQNVKPKRKMAEKVEETDDWSDF